MTEYLIEGGGPLTGTIRASGNKNAALPCLAAALLSDEPVVLRNIPDIEDVQVMLEIYTALGGKVKAAGPNAWRLTMEDIKTSEIPPEQAKKIRASILFAGPLLARTGMAVLPPPGGDVIGRRRLDTHFLALTELGVKVKSNGAFIFSARTLRGKDIFLDEASVTATENAVMAAVLAKGETTLTNAASEPHVQDLCRMLVSMGARIQGIGSNILSIRGVKKLSGCDFTIGADFMEVGSFIGLAAATRGEITIEGAREGDLRSAKIAFAKLGIKWECQGTSIHVPKKQRMAVNCDLGGMIPKIDDAPWPGFPPGFNQHHHRSGYPGTGRSAGSRKDVRIPDVFRRQTYRHGRPDSPLRSPPGGSLGPFPPDRIGTAQPRCAGRHGHDHRRPLRRREKRYPQRLPDRAGLRKNSTPAVVPGRPHRVPVAACCACRILRHQAQKIHKREKLMN
jgi:UDP-N-acetylglucosamine 1-carboxyvinyltransferase